MIIGRDIYRKHPNRWTEEEWKESVEWMALNMIENEKNAS